jgi:hypothetical protein
MTTSNLSDSEASAQDSKVDIKLLDQDGTILDFKVKQNVAFRKILDAFAQNVKKSSSELRLLFNGKVINLGQTPYDLGMANGDELEVVTSQTGGSYN